MQSPAIFRALRCDDWCRTWSCQVWIIQRETRDALPQTEFREFLELWKERTYDLDMLCLHYSEVGRAAGVVS
jgi:hypothetical protein